jgi:hypothetical protein
MPRSRAGLGHANETAARSAAVVLGFLPPDLVSFLASLDGVEPSIANAAVQLLPFGSRTALEVLDPPLAVVGEPIDALGHRTLILTAFAWKVIAEARSALDESSSAVRRLSARADVIARRVESRRLS